MNSTIEIPRKLAESILFSCMFSMIEEDYLTLRALLDAPVDEPLTAAQQKKLLLQQVCGMIDEEAKQLKQKIKGLNK